MGIVRRGIGTQKTGTTSLANMVAPTEALPGDVLLAFVLDHATSGTSGAPSAAWTYRGGTSGTGGRFQIYSAQVGGAGLTGTQWTWANLTSRSQGVIVAYSGVDGNAVIDVAVGARLNATGAPAATGCLSISPSTPNTMIIGACACLAGASTWSAQAVVTDPALGADYFDSAYSSYCSIALCEAIKATAGATGNFSATQSTNTLVNIGVLIALRELKNSVPAVLVNA